MAEHPHDFHLDALENSVAALVESQLHLHRDFAVIVSETKLLLQQLSDLLPTLPNQHSPDAAAVVQQIDGPAEMFDQLSGGMETVTPASLEGVYGLVAAVEVFDEMPAQDFTHAVEFEAVHEPHGVEDTPMQSQETRCCNPLPVSPKISFFGPEFILHAAEEDTILLLGTCIVDSPERYNGVRSPNNLLESMNMSYGDSVGAYIARLTLKSFDPGGRLWEARNVFDRLPQPDVVTCSALLSGHARNGHVKDAKELLTRIKHLGLGLNLVTWNGTGETQEDSIAFEASKLRQSGGKSHSSSTFRQGDVSFKISLVGPLQLLSSTVTMLAVPTPSLTAILARGGTSPAIAVPLVALGTQSGTTDIVDVSATAIAASFAVHNGTVRGLRWFGNSRLVSFSYTQASEKTDGYVNKLVVTCFDPGGRYVSRALLLGFEFGIGYAHRVLRTVGQYFHIDSQVEVGVDDLFLTHAFVQTKTFDPGISLVNEKLLRDCRLLVFAALPAITLWTFAIPCCIVLQACLFQTFPMLGALLVATSCDASILNETVLALHNGKIQAVAYKLELQESASIHPIFHVSLLRKCIGSPEQQVTPLHMVDSTSSLLLHPTAILEQRVLHKGNLQVEHWLVQWEGLPATDATWEDRQKLEQFYPSLNLEDKVVLAGGVML